MIVTKYNKTQRVQVILMQLDDSLDNRFELDKINKDVTSHIFYHNRQKLDILKSIELDKTYCFFMGSERLDPVTVNFYIRKLNDLGITHCVYTDKSYLEMLAVESNTTMDCTCSSQQLLWKGHSSKCPFKKRYNNPDFIS